jgi:hypothetical protein
MAGPVWDSAVLEHVQWLACGMSEHGMVAIVWLVRKFSLIRCGVLQRGNVAVRIGIRIPEWDASREGHEDDIHVHRMQTRGGLA